VLLLAGVYFVFRYNTYRINKRNKMLNEKAGLESDVRASQLSALKVQMNPHFIFNALNSIQEFILTNEKKLANTYLGKFSDLMRITLDLSQEEYVHLNEELRALNLYLELENLRFSNEIECTVDTGNIQSPGKILIPPMLLQPFVENAIKHGLLHKKGVKKLFVSLSVEPEVKLLHCIIADNGIGRKKSGKLKKFHPQKHKSFATSATAKRLELLNTGNKQKIRVVYIDLESTTSDALGTRVELSIPYLET
jgi:LytS/YehU family sensor histidine kinase